MSRPVKGLLIKDMRILASQYRIFLILIILWCFIMTGKFNVSFFIGYSAMMAAFMTLGTISQDEFDNGMAFLLAMPVSRRDYVSEKFLLGIMLTTLASALLCAADLLVTIAKGTPENVVGNTNMDYAMAMAVSMLAACLMLAFEIPVQLKFGQAKGKLVTLVMIGFMTAGGTVLGSLNDMAKTGQSGIVKAAGDAIGLGSGGIAALAAAVSALLLFASYKLSCGIIEKREY